MRNNATGEALATIGSQHHGHCFHSGVEAVNGDAERGQPFPTTQNCSNQRLGTLLIFPSATIYKTHRDRD